MTTPADCRLLSTPWFRTPGSLEPGVQIFAIGDVCGQEAAFAGALAAIRHTPRRAGVRILVLLGNLVGHGPDSLACLDLAMDAHELAGVDALIALPGNQEIMLAQALHDPAGHMERWSLCGGRALLREAGVGEDATPEEAMDTLGAFLPVGWAQGVFEAQGWYKNGDLLFVHAGIHPTIDWARFVRQPADSPNPYHWAWMREPFLSWTKGWDPQKKMVVVHGHTPAVSQWVGTDSEMAQFAPLHHRRIVLDGGAHKRPQVAFVEAVAGQARVACVQHGRGDFF